MDVNDLVGQYVAAHVPCMLHAGIKDGTLSELIKCLCDTLFLYVDKASKNVVEDLLHRLVDVYGKLNVPAYSLSTLH